MNQATGNHCILELYNCPEELLDDERFIRQTLRYAAEKSGSTLLAIVSHKFDPQGVTAIGLLAESHISIHTWPEMGYAAADVFTCGICCDPVKACRILIERCKAGRHTQEQVERGSAVTIDAVRLPKPIESEEECPQMPHLSRYG